MSNKLGPGKPVKRASKDWDCFIFERRRTSENIIKYQIPRDFVSCFVTQEEVFQ